MPFAYHYLSCFELFAHVLFARQEPLHCHQHFFRERDPITVSLVSSEKPIERHSLLQHQVYLCLFCIAKLPDTLSDLISRGSICWLAVFVPTCFWIHLGFCL
eukprot:TRINITY_DN20292_c0_g1_i2.p2 TRINITY_DN20292_c0_g1~~TRINITY_DN20292_c0_g1_i2.p2  ORF type:complete len:102 (-),score=9.96 TRINITY_DN20292_c0_g1_i2:172-477(-)